VLFLAQNGLNYLFYSKAPALVLVGVLFYALSEGSSFGTVVGLWAGFLIDLFGTGRPGLCMSTLAVAGYFSGVISSKVFQDSLLTEIFLPASALYFVTLAEVWILRSQAGETTGLGLLAEAFLPWPFVMTAISSPWLFGRLRRWTSSAGRGRSSARY
jgi:rod shape-determining protein MreD